MNRPVVTLGLAVALLAVALVGCEESIGVHRHRELTQDRDAVRANAVITGIHEMSMAGERAPMPGPYCSVSVHITPDSGEPFDASGQTIVPYTMMTRYAPGNPITVRFDPKNRDAIYVEAPVDPVTPIDGGAPTAASSDAGGVSI